MSEVSYITFDTYDDVYYKFIFRANGYIAICFGFAAMYLIATSTPKSFGAYKYFLFNIAFCACLFDFYITEIYSPKPLFPALVMCPEGYVRTSNEDIGVYMFCGFLMFFGSTAIAVGSAFLYRYASISNNVYRLMSPLPLIFIVFLHVFYMSPSIFFYCWSARDRSQIHEFIFNHWPNIRPHMIGKGCAAIVYDNSLFTRIFVLSCVIQLSLVLLGVLYLMTKSLTALQLQRSRMSTRTYKMHNKLLLTLVFQLIVPLITLFIPFCLMCLLAYMEVENSHWFHMGCFIIGTLHSPLNTIMMLVFLLPYRRKCLWVLTLGKWSAIKHESVVGATHASAF